MAEFARSIDRSPGYPFRLLNRQIGCSVETADRIADLFVEEGFIRPGQRAEVWESLLRLQRVA